MGQETRKQRHTAWIKLDEETMTIVREKAQAGYRNISNQLKYLILLGLKYEKLEQQERKSSDVQ